MYLNGFFCQTGDAEYETAQKATGSEEPYWFRETSYGGDMYGYGDEHTRIRHDYGKSIPNTQKQSLEDTKKELRKKMRGLELVKAANSELEATLTTRLEDLGKRSTAKEEGKTEETTRTVVQRTEIEAARRESLEDQGNNAELQFSGFPVPQLHELGRILPPDVASPDSAENPPATTPSKPRSSPVADVRKHFLRSNRTTLTDGSHRH
jgi:hypothetical protein